MAKKRRRRRRLKPIPKLILWLMLIAIIVWIATSIFSCANNNSEGNSSVASSSQTSSMADVSSQLSSEEVELLNEDEKWYLFLVNGQNPLPDDYEYEKNLVSLENKYINGSLKQVNKKILKPLTKMIDAAREDGVWLYVWSPYRSYSTQKMLFERQINNLIASGTPENEAEEKAATMVARPGTSEHHTGLAVDINMANSSFDNSEQFKWLKENAADYGFIMRYPEDKQSITGVMYESWHWRYVTPKHAKIMKEKDMCLEEYIDYLKQLEVVS